MSIRYTFKSPEDFLDFAKEARCDVFQNVKGWIEGNSNEYYNLWKKYKFSENLNSWFFTVGFFHNHPVTVEIRIIDFKSQEGHHKRVGIWHSPSAVTYSVMAEKFLETICPKVKLGPDTSTNAQNAHIVLNG